MIEILYGRSLVYCLNNIILLTMTNSDFILYSINNDFRIETPVFKIELREKFELDVEDMPDMYLFDLDHYNLSEFMDLTYRYRFFNPRAKFILVGSEIDPNMSELLVSNFVVNVIYLQKSTEEIFTIFPYKERMLHNPSKEWKSISNCKADIKDVFQQKVPKVWINSSIRTMFVAFKPFMLCVDCGERGPLIDILDEISVCLNLTVDFHELEYNGSDFEEFDRNIMLDKKFDLSLGEFVDINLDYLYPHDFTNLFWIVPASEEMAPWKYLFIVYSKQVWMMWILSFVSLCVSRFFTNTFFEKIPNILSILFDAVTILKMSIEQSADLSSSFLTETIIFVLTYFFTFIMTAIYKNQFLYLLLGFNYEKMIDSVDDIMERNLTICSPLFTSVQAPFSGTKTKEDYFESHYEDCDFSNDVVIRLTRNKDVVYVDNQESFNLVQDQYLDENGRSLLHKIDKSIILSYFGSTLTKGHPITENLNRYFKLMDQHGIKKLIMSRYNKRNSGQTSNLQTQSLSISHIITSFYILILGLVLSVSLFVYEKFIFPK